MTTPAREAIVRVAGARHGWISTAQLDCLRDLYGQRESDAELALLIRAIELNGGVYFRFV